MEQENLSAVNDSQTQRERIVVFGVGGGGGNALNHIIESGVKGVEFIAANTDAKALNLNKAQNKILLGEKLTRGLGAGGNPQTGTDAAKESIERVKEYITGADMIFLTAGMGGGTGTGAVPVIAEAARGNGVLTVGVVTLPFEFEMAKRMKTARAGIEILKKHVDALLVIENQRLLAMADEKMRMLDAYKLVDEVLRQGVQGVTDLLTDPGLINLDFADIRSVMANGGTSIMGIGSSEGDNRAEQAASAAIKSKLMPVDLSGAKCVLLNVTTGPDVTLVEMTRAAEVIKDAADPDANVFWGHVVSEKIGSGIRVTLIATGIPDSVNFERMAASKSQGRDMDKIQRTSLMINTNAQAIRSIYPQTGLKVRKDKEDWEIMQCQPSLYRRQQHNPS